MPSGNERERRREREKERKRELMPQFHGCECLRETSERNIAKVAQFDGCEYCRGISEKYSTVPLWPAVVCCVCASLL